MTLVALMYDEDTRRAVTWDLQAYLGVDVDRFWAGGVSWNRMWDWCSELLRDPWAHTAAAIRGDSLVADPVSVAHAEWVEVWYNAQRPKGKVPFRYPRSWTAAREGVERAVAVSPVGDVEREARRQALDDLLGL